MLAATKVIQLWLRDTHRQDGAFRNLIEQVGNVSNESKEVLYIENIKLMAGITATYINRKAKNLPLKHKNGENNGNHEIELDKGKNNKKDKTAENKKGEKDNKV